MNVSNSGQINESRGVRRWAARQRGRTRLAILELHIAVLLFGVAGLFGKWVHASPLMMVLGRTVFASATLVPFWLLTRDPAGAARSRGAPALKRGAAIAVSGAVLALHWVSFFEAIRVSTVAVALVTFSSFPMFVTVLEPIAFAERARRIDLMTAGLVLGGLIVVAPKWSDPAHSSVLAGAIWGMGSGLSFAVLSLLNRWLVRAKSPGTDSPREAVAVAAGQNLSAALVMLALLPWYAQGVTRHDLFLLAVLGVACTALAHTLFIASLTRVRAQMASVVSGLEAVYGILFAVLFLGEWPAPRTVAGGVLIFSAVWLATVWRPRDARPDLDHET